MSEEDHVACHDLLSICSYAWRCSATEEVILAYSVSVEACGANHVSTLCLTASVVPSGVTLCLRRPVELILHSQPA